MYIDKFFDLIKVHKTDLTKIRIGSEHDGGYVVPDELCDTIDLYSFGIGDDTSFEDAFSNKYGGAVYCFDHTINDLPGGGNDFYFHSIGVGAGEGKLPMRELRKKYVKPNRNLLKVDIEYDEWDNIDYSNEYDIMIIELHILTVEDRNDRSPYFTSLYRKFNGEINEFLFKKYYFFLDALLNNYFIFHIHGNNSLPKTKIGEYSFPPLLEFTLINRKFEKHLTGGLDTEFPSTIDRPNKTDRPDFDFLFPFKIPTNE